MHPRNSRCRFCAEAKRALEKRGVSYEEISIEVNSKTAADVKWLSGSAGIVPVLIIGDEVKVGFGGRLNRLVYGGLPRKNGNRFFLRIICSL